MHPDCTISPGYAPCLTGKTTTAHGLRNGSSTQPPALQRQQEEPMKRQTLAGIVTVVTTAILAPAPGSAESSAAVERQLAGVWMVTTTPRDCTTGNPFPQAAFDGLFTFHKDGTMSAWVQNALISVTRSSSHGLWEQTSGWSRHSFEFVHLRYDLSGTYVGRQVAKGTLVLGESGDELTTESSTSVFDLDGNRIGGGCASATGVRFGRAP
jgi:hypothetical protein